jgi:hypothetical protein
MKEWQLAILILSVLILPGVSKYIAARFDILRNTSGLELERSERRSEDAAIRERCGLIHKGVDEKLRELKTDVGCLDKKMDRLLRKNGIETGE